MTRVRVGGNPRPTSYDRAMDVRRAFVLVLVALVALAGCAGSARVLEVNGSTFDRDELTEMIERRLEPDSGVASSSDVASLLTLQVVVAITEQQLAARDLVVSDDEVRAEYDRLIEVNGSEGAPPYDAVRDELFLELGIARGFDDEQDLIDAISSADVTVDPRYGSWTGIEAGIVPPTGPDQ